MNRVHNHSRPLTSAYSPILPKVEYCNKNNYEVKLSTTFIMETKKTPKANLENKRNLFFEFGLVISISICLLGFELNSGVKEVTTFGPLSDQPIEDLNIPWTKAEEPKPPPPPLPKVADLILIADNGAEIPEDPYMLDSEANSKTAIYAPTQLDRKPEAEVDEDVLFLIAEEMPEFPGGYPALLNFLAQHIKYPAIAAEVGVQGRVTVNFVVNKDGSISDAKIIRGVDQSLDKEALRVIYSMPKWKPGKQGGQPVRVSFNVPINFVLR